MKNSPNNPQTNKLSSEITEADIIKAVSTSGYPLQMIIANSLRSQEFNVQEEWSYIDKDSEELRTIDILAEKEVFDFTTTKEQPRVRPTLNLLIECKHSTKPYPYVFFLTPDKPWLPYFPLLAGLFKYDIDIITDDDISTYIFSIINMFGLDSHNFIRRDVDYSMLFTKCVQKSKDIEFSGSEAFHGILLPLLQAMSHFSLVESPPATALYFDLHLVIGVGIIDAPMIGVRAFSNPNELIYLPWVRVLRHETERGQKKFHGDKGRLFAIDIVHKDFFEEYLSKYLLPFAEDFSGLCIKHQQIVASGKAFVKGLGKNSGRDIEQRLMPIKVGTKIRRVKDIGKNIFLGHKGW